MARASFLEADIARIIRAARKQNAIVQMDLKTLIVTIFPAETHSLVRPGDPSGLAPDGKDNFDEEGIDYSRPSL